MSMTRVCKSCGAENRIPVEKLDRVARCGRCKTPLPPQAEPLSIEGDADFRELVERSPLPVLADFWAPWCGPCVAVAPEIDRLARERAGQVLVTKINTELLPQIAQQFGIRSIPTLIRFDRGKETKRASGAMGASQIQRTFGL